jgi:aconitate hydratase
MSCRRSGRASSISAPSGVYRGIVPVAIVTGSGGLIGSESVRHLVSQGFDVVGVENGEAHEVTVRADGREFTCRVRLDTPREREYLRHGGILRYVLRRLAA